MKIFNFGNENLTPEQKALKMRKFKIGTVSVAITVIFIVAVILANIALNILTARFPLKFDATGESIYNLSLDTEEYLKQTDKKVEIVLAKKLEDIEQIFTQYYGSTYYKEGYITELFENYPKQSNNITMNYVDSVTNPDVYQKMNVTLTDSVIAVVYCEETKRGKAIGLDDIVVFSDDGKSVEYFNAEKSITSAIIYVCKEDIRDIHFLTGHKESKNEYFEEFFKLNGFNVNTVTLGQNNAFSSKTAALVIYNPVEDFSESDILALREFMNNSDEMREYNLGRSLYVFLDNNAPKLPNLYAFLREYCIVPVDEYVIDLSTEGSGLYSYTSGGVTQRMPVLNATFPHETIGKDLKKTVVMGMQLQVGFPKSFELLETSDGDTISTITAKSILGTTAEAYTKPITNDDKADLTFNSATDKKGERILGALATRTFFDANEQEYYTGNVAVIGSSTFAAESFMRSSTYQNAEYLKQLINATIGDDAIELSVPQRDLSPVGFSITRNDWFTIGIVLIVLPIVSFAAAAVVVYVKRKHL